MRNQVKLVAHNIKDDPYKSWLKALKFRHKHIFMIQVFKILNGIDRIEPDIFFWMAEEHGLHGTG